MSGGLLLLSMLLVEYYNENDKTRIVIDLVTFYCKMILKVFSLTVKAAILIFTPGRGSAISSAKQGKSGSIYNLVKNFCLGRANVRAFHKNPICILTEFTFINL